MMKNDIVHAWQISMIEVSHGWDLNHQANGNLRARDLSMSFLATSGTSSGVSERIVATR